MPIQKFIISQDENIYEAFPDVALTKQEKLICVFAECNHHGDRSYTRLMLSESHDRGRTWTPKYPLTKGTDGRPYWNCPRISRLKDDRLIIVADKIFGEGETKAKNYLWLSDAEGESWEGPFETPVTGIVPDQLCELENGRWLLSAHQENENGYLAQHLWYSDDQGESWTGPITVASEDGLHLCEVSLLPLDHKTIIAFFRENSGQGLDCFKAISYDYGESWHGVYKVPLPGCHRPVSGFLNSGKIMITYRFMQGGKGWLGAWTQNFFVALTDVESALATKREEQTTRIMPIDYDRSPVSDLGYSGWVQFDDGEIYIVNYIVDDASSSHIRGYSLSEEDFLIEK